jgi:hypothetical protein
MLFNPTYEIPQSRSITRSDSQKFVGCQEQIPEEPTSFCFLPAEAIEIWIIGRTVDHENREDTFRKLDKFSPEAPFPNLQELGA